MTNTHTHTDRRIRDTQASWSRLFAKKQSLHSRYRHTKFIRRHSATLASHSSTLLTEKNCWAIKLIVLVKHWLKTGSTRTFPGSSLWLAHITVTFSTHLLSCEVSVFQYFIEKEKIILEEKEKIDVFYKNEYRKLVGWLLVLAISQHKKPYRSFLAQVSYVRRCGLCYKISQVVFVYNCQMKIRPGNSKELPNLSLQLSAILVSLTLQVSNPV